MRHLRISIAALLLVMLVYPAAFAQTPPMMTDKEVAKFIDDWPSVSQWLHAKGKQFDSDSAGQSIAALTVGSDFSAFLRGKGWSVERFSYVAGTVFALVSYVAFERQNPDMMKQFDDAIAQIRANSSMSEVDKKEAIKNLEETKKSLLSMSSEADFNEPEIKLVRAMYDTIYKLLQDTQQ
ncbi:MAG TPA: hypothetical protein VMX33_08125 [bacterium]|nr:hypothetical protein [bacterium]